MKKIVLFFLASTVLLQINSAKAQVLASDSLALVAIYNSTNGAGWTRSDNWLTGPVPTWFGVTVDNKRVTELEFCTTCNPATAGNNLTGSIPSAIGNLTKLRSLGMSNNQLTGSIPATIGNLTELYWLDLASNKLSGNLPATIGNLTSLNSLLVAANQLTGPLPKEIGNLSSLANLSIISNQFSGSIPPEISGLTSLIAFQASSNQFSGSIPKEIGSLTNLLQLDLERNQLSGEIPAEIGNLVNLYAIYLQFNNLTGGIPKEIGNLGNLTTLYLNNNQMNGTIPHEIGGLTSLTTFIAYNNQLTGSIPGEIGNLTELTTLSLYNNDLSGALPSSIGNLTKLQSLSLSDNQFTGSVPSSFGALAKLDIFNVSNNQLSGSIPASLANLTVARYIMLQNNKFTGALPASFSNMPALQYLGLEKNMLTGLPDLSANTSLWSLSVQDNSLVFGDLESNINVPGFKYLPQNVVLTKPGQSLTEGDVFTTGFSVSGAYNEYKWIKDGFFISGASATNFTIPSVTLSDAGSYSLVITNTKVSGLSFTTDPVVLSVTPAPYAEIRLDSGAIQLANAGVVRFPKTVTGEITDALFKVSNTGTAPMIISSIAFSGQFGGAFPTPPVTLTPGSSIIINVAYGPASDGPATGVLKITSNATQPEFYLNFEGTSYTPYAEIRVDSAATQVANNDVLRFPKIVTGEAADAPLTISNTGTGPMVISAIQANGAFSVSFTETLPVTLAPNSSMTINCRYTSVADGSVTGSLSITGDAMQPLFFLNLEGTSYSISEPSIPVITRKPGMVIREGSIVLSASDSVLFPMTSKGNSQSKQLDITNNGDAPLVINGLVTTGDFKSDIQGPLTLLPNEHQTLTIEFIPSGDGTRTGLLTVTSNADSLSRNVDLSGVAFTERRTYELTINNVAALSGSNVLFDRTEVGSEQEKVISLTNTGNVNLVIESVEATGTFVVAHDAGVVLTAGETTQIRIAFVPDHIGEHKGSMTIVTNSDTPVTVLGLAGEGEADIEVFNVVTTRRNGKNDFLAIKNITLFPGNSVQVFDRWGNLVYSKEGYDNVNETFRGMSRNGNALPEGTYFYHIDKNNGSRPLNGFVMVRN